MWIFQIYALTPDELVTSGVLAETQVDAISKAIDRLKAQFGAGARVTYAVRLFDAGDIRRVRHTGLAKLLNEFDQLQFVLWHLRKAVDESIRLLAELIAIVKEQQERQQAE